ncbi:MAG: hypothetical protein FJ087_05310 [Deltaproteobacteria bacterium]|nr:hypothetical protein [Deltaproteobacteria bacterium]
MRKLQVLWIVGLLLAAPLPAGAETVAAFLDNASSTLGGSAPAVLSLLRSDLGRRGLSAAHGVGESFADPDAVRPAIEASGARRVFVLSVMPLGEKLVVGLGEHRMPSLDLVRSERMTASRIEELDTVLPRLVDAVLGGRTADQTVSVETVTEHEGRPWRKRAGQFLWGLGIPFGASLRGSSEVSYGLGLRFSYEMAHARIDADTWFQLNAQEGMIHWSAPTIAAYWLPLDTNVSPYVGGGVGFGGSTFRDTDHTMGVLLTVGGGVEFFRLYGTRLMFDVRAGLPTYRVETGSRGDKAWVPVFTAMLSFLW